MLDKIPFIKTINTFPRKTRIAVWALLIPALIAFILGLVIIIFGGGTDWGILIPLYGVAYVGIGVLFFIPVFLLVLRKSWAWWLAIIILFVALIISFQYTFMLIFLLKEGDYALLIIPLVIYSYSFILLVFDKRNLIAQKKDSEKSRFKKVILILLIFFLGFLGWIITSYLPLNLIILYQSALKTKNEFFCFIIPSMSEVRQACYSNLAIEKKDANLCRRGYDDCFTSLAEMMKDETICDKFIPESFDCYRSVAKAKQDQSLCERIRDIEHRNPCYYDLRLCKKIINNEKYRNQCNDLLQR